MSFPSNPLLDGRDIVSVASAFGEVFLYYNAVNPVTGELQRKKSFSKRVLVQGVPFLISAGFYLDYQVGGM